MGVMPRERQCYIKGCEAQAEYACMRCGKPLCKDHAHLISLERRVGARELTEGGSLARLPSEVKVYAFCQRCR
jgi:hypothetical protein